jgi:hypothetical protein
MGLVDQTAGPASARATNEDPQTQNPTFLEPSIIIIIALGVVVAGQACKVI